MKTICLLDRNIISDIKRFHDTGSSQNISLAKAQDKPYNIISSLSSTLEGGKGNLQTLPEFHETTEEETRLISFFYKRASVDSSFLKANTLNSYTALYQDIKSRLELFSPLISLVQSTFGLHNTPSKARARKLEDTLVEFASSNKIPLTGVPAIGIISAIYGNPDSRKILKPQTSELSEKEKSDAVYNTLYDLEIAKRLIMLKATVLRDNSYNIKLVTRDQGLKKFIDCVSESHCAQVTENMAGDTIVNFEIPLDDQLLPTLKTDEDKLALRDRMKSWS